MRWTWANVLGADGAKVFDNLILVGVSDPRFQHLYRDPLSPYVFFDVPRSEVPGCINCGKSGIQISNTNPQKTGTPIARGLFDRFQVTPAELTAKYRHA